MKKNNRKRKKEIKKEWNRNNLKNWKITKSRRGGCNGSHFSTTFFVSLIACRLESDNEHHVV